MKVKWKPFSQRRGLTIKDFCHMTYQEYSRWCEYRNVIPASEKIFERGNTANHNTENTALEKPQKVLFEAKTLKKKLKAELEALCAFNGIEVDSTWTKKKMTEALINLNK